MASAHRLEGVLLAAVVVGLLVACDPEPVMSQIGVSGDATGHVVISFVPCGGQAVRTVEVDEEVGAGRRPVWLILGGTTVWPGSVQVGSAPSGFRTVVPFRTGLAVDRHYLAGVNRSGGGFQVVMDFVPAELAPTNIEDGHGHKISPSVFRTNAERFCAGL